MKEEVNVAVQFLIRLIESTTASDGNGTLSGEQLEGFQERLKELLCARFENHWFPEKPQRGQGYRCIRVNEVDRKDSTIDKAAVQAGLSYDQLNLPTELTIWVDPKEVCCRFGEHQGSFCTLATFKNGGTGELFLDQVNFEEIRKKSQELRDKARLEMSMRKNGRRGFLSGGGSRAVGGGTAGSPSGFKGTRSSFLSGGYSSHHHHQNSHHTNTHSHHHSNNSHHGHHHHNIQQQGGQHTPSPAAVSWYNSVNSAGGGNANNANTHSNSDMFSTSPPNHFSMYGLAKFSPPKYPYGSPSKWSSPPHPSSYGPQVPSAKGDKYHWFNSNKATIKA